MLRVSILILTLILSTGIVSAKTVVIDTPTPCYSVKSVERDRVYLESKTANCIQVTGKVSVEVDDFVNEISIYADGKLWKREKVQSFNTDSVVKALDRADDMKKNLKLKLEDNPYKKEAEQKAQEAYRYYSSEEYQNKIKTESERIQKEVFGNVIESYYSDMINKNSLRRAKLLSDERLYLFISSSIPDSVVRRYIKDIDRIGDRNIVVVMRGFVGGAKYVKPTLEYVSRILKKDQECDFLKNRCETYRVNLQIDPLLFRRYGINRVPALVYARGVNTLDLRTSEGIEDNTKIDNFYVIYGDASLEYLIEKIAEETKSESLIKLEEKLREGFYGKSGVAP